MHLSKSYLQAINNIKSKGFSHIKLELEADLSRGDREEDCDECNEGSVSCYRCDNSGVVLEDGIDRGIHSIYIECSYCSGGGYLECGNCSGTGNSRDEYSTSWCEDFILQKLSPATRDAIVYGNFYEDGSVDSEYTFTIPIEEAHRCIEVIEAFNALSYEINGSRPDVNNAGMHIAILPSGNYPCRGNLLNKKFMTNFCTEVTKLLPALYFLASSGNKTRSLEYRQPKVSPQDKYSAIYTHGDSCMEYRIFDTCYERPETLFEFIETISATLKYYSLDKVSIKYKRFVFPYNANSSYSKLNEWYRHVDNYDALNQTIKHIKPNKSTKQLKSDKDIDYTRAVLLQELREAMTPYRSLEYARYVEKVREQNDLYLDNYYRSVRRAFGGSATGSYSGMAYIHDLTLALNISLGQLVELWQNESKAKKTIKKLGLSVGFSVRTLSPYRLWLLEQITSNRGVILDPNLALTN